MSDQEKFAAFKQQKINENENLYGEEIRKKYDKQAIEQANQTWSQLTQEQVTAMQIAENQLFTALNQLLCEKTLELSSQTAQLAFEAHKQWLTIVAPYYNETYHQSLADMYINDGRFAAYYDRNTMKPAAHLLHDIIYYYTKQA